MKDKEKRYETFDLAKLVFILKSNFEFDHYKEDESYAPNQDQEET